MDQTLLLSLFTLILGLLAGYFLPRSFGKRLSPWKKPLPNHTDGSAGQGTTPHEPPATKNANDQLMEEYTLREKTLASNLLAIEQSNAFLRSMLEHLKQVNLKVRTAGARDALGDLIDQVEDQLKDKNWDHFERFFAIANNDFLECLQQTHPDLTPMDRRLCMLVYMGLSSKEIADITMQRCETVEMARHRLRTKLELDRTVHLGAYLAELSVRNTR